MRFLRALDLHDLYSAVYPSILRRLAPKESSRAKPRSYGSKDDEIWYTNARTCPVFLMMTTGVDDAVVSWEPSLSISFQPIEQIGTDS